MDAQARRQLRIQKILQNSESRLKLITNHTYDVDVNHSSKHINTYTVEKLISPINAHSETSMSHRPVVQIEKASNEDTVSNGSTTTLYENDVSPSASSMPSEFKCVTSSSIYSRYWIIAFLSVTIRLLLFFNEYFTLMSPERLASNHLNKVLVPFIIFEVTERSFFKPVLPRDDWWRILYHIVRNIEPTTVNRIIVIVRLISEVMQDLMVYIFAFVCLDQILPNVFVDSAP